MDQYDGILVDESGSPPQPPPAAPVVEEAPAEVAPETPAPPVESAPTPPVPDVDPVQRRIDQVVFRQRQAENEAAYWRGQAEARSAQPPAQPVPPSGAPKEEDFERHADYVEAMVDYRLEQKLAAQRETDASQAQQQAQQRTVAAQHTAILAREADILKEHPDYYARCSAVVEQIAPHVKWAIELTGAHGPDLVLYLHDHPEAVAKLNQTPPHALGIELGMLRAHGSPAVSSAPPARPKPEPPTPLVGGGRTVNPETYHENMPQDAYEAWRRKTSTLYRRPGA